MVCRDALPQPDRVVGVAWNAWPLWIHDMAEGQLRLGRFTRGLNDLSRTRSANIKPGVWSDNLLYFNVMSETLSAA